jgi:tetratricopeptide (TPR) repeat protein
MFWLLAVGALGVVGGMFYVDARKGWRREQLEKAMRAALERSEWPVVADLCRELLGYIRSRRHEIQIRLILARSVGCSGRHDLAVAELRLVEEGFLYPHEKASLRNQLAYHLGLDGKVAEALVEVARAEDSLSQLATTEQHEAARTMAATVRGTRGIIHFLDGNLDEAERDLQSALKMQPFGEERAALDAERWWWLSEISRRRGHEDEARRRLESAAVHLGTEFGSRAAVALGRPAAV